MSRLRSDVKKEVRFYSDVYNNHADIERYRFIKAARDEAKKTNPVEIQNNKRRKIVQTLTKERQADPNNREVYTKKMLNETIKMFGEEFNALSNNGEITKEQAELLTRQYLLHRDVLKTFDKEMNLNVKLYDTFLDYIYKLNPLLVELAEGKQLELTK